MECTTHNHTIQQLLKSHGLKITPARLALLDVLEHAGKPLAVKDIEECMAGTSIDTVTIYRTLEALKDVRVITEVHVSNKQAYYELAALSHHHHLVCESCGVITDIDVHDDITISSRRLQQNNFARINRHSLEFFGTCVDCEQKA